MRHILATARYSKWDGSQSFEDAANRFIEEMVDDLLDYGDLSWSIRNLMGRGLRDDEGKYRNGLREMRKKLRDIKRQRLDQFDMSSVLEDIEDQLKDILELERETIRQWREQSEGSGQDSQTLPEMMSQIADEHEQTLNELPDDAPGQMKGLEDYEFLSKEAQQKYEELVEKLRKAVTQKLLSGLQDTIENLTPEDIERMKQMMNALNEMLAKHMNGEEETGFEEFMDEFGDMFGDNQPQDIDELIQQLSQSMAAAQSMMQSMSYQQRSQLQDVLQGAFNDQELNQAIETLSSTLDYFGASGRSYRFRGDEQLDLETAMHLMEEMHEVDDLLDQLQKADRPDALDAIDRDALRRLLGDDAVNTVDELQGIQEILEKAGYIREENAQSWSFTPKGMRLIAHKALHEIYSQLKKHHRGNHAVPEEGSFGERMDQAKSYEFGDPMHLNMSRTIRNALLRNGRKTPVKLEEQDFEVYRTELITSTATAILIDCSWSMFLRDAFRAAKKVAMALHQLIQTQYQKDSLYIIGFSEYARVVHAHDIPFLDSDQYVMGTNMQHALLLAEKALRKHPASSKQILLISDGEPTAHLENGYARFAYPPTSQTLQATYRAAKFCARQGIEINTFMLDSSPYLRQFVDEIARTCNGRVFFTSPYKLGEYVLVDYMRNKRTRISRSI